MSLIRWEPFQELVSLREAMNRLFEESFVWPWPERLVPGRVGSVPLDVYETEDTVVVKAALPGIKPEDVDITVRENTLVIKGEAKAAEEVREENYLRRELRYGAFSREVSLPTMVRADRAEAMCENGILTIKLPKAEEVKPKTIKIKTK